MTFTPDRPNPLAGKRIPRVPVDNRYNPKTACIGGLALTRLPSEIAAGVDPSAIGTGMSKAFREQLVTTGCRDPALLLDAAAKTVKAVSSDITEKLNPAAERSRLNHKTGNGSESGSAAE